MNKKILDLYNYISFECGVDWALFLKRAGGLGKLKTLLKTKTKEEIVKDILK